MIFYIKRDLMTVMMVFMFLMYCTYIFLCSDIDENDSGDLLISRDKKGENLKESINVFVIVCSQSKGDARNVVRIILRRK